MSSYLPPDLTRAEVAEQRGHDPRPADCLACQSGTPVDHWPTAVCNSAFRRDEQGTERLFRAHCTCDLCF
ncbi:hypothetical protein ACFY0G_17410 [Streptomyces sp. NPDC001552]|uniref:hypothetical protein n=1 Tax=Streptomyces sp. NPDC001552 TaxID=3364587 RepID=UPI003675FB0E